MESSRILRVALSSPAELCLQQPRGCIEMCRVDERNMQATGADRRLQLAAGPFSDLAAVIDHRDALGEMVGFLEILRCEQNGDARLPPCRGSCAKRSGAPSDQAQWWARQGTARRASQSSEAAISSRRRMPPE